MAVTVFTAAQLATIYAPQGRTDIVTNTARLVFRLTGSGLVFYVTGTDCKLLGTFAGANPFAYYLDDALQAAPTYAAGELPLFTGLSDVQRKIELRLNAAYSGATGNYVTAAGAVSVTGAVPAIDRVTTRGPQVPATQGYGVCTTVLPDVLTAAQQQPSTGGISYASAPPLTTSSFQGLAVRVRGRADNVLVFTNTNNGACYFALAKDGVIVARTTITNNGHAWAQVGGTGLDDGSEHDWEVITGGNAGGLGAPDMIQLGGANAALSATSPTVRSGILCLGDSITASVSSGGGGGVSTQGDGTLAWPVLLGKLLSKDAIAMGRSGSVSLVGAEQCANDLKQAMRVSNITHVVILYGRNDLSGEAAETAHATMFSRLLAVPGFTGKIVVVTNPIHGTATGIAVNAGKTAAVAAAASSRVVLVDGSAWSISAVSDNTHYDITGHATFAANLNASGAMADIPSAGAAGSGTKIPPVLTPP